MDWDDGTRRWNIETVEGGELTSYRARAVVSAAGALQLPSYPDFREPNGSAAPRSTRRAGILPATWRANGSR